MKKLFAISLLATYLFNLLGYTFIFDFIIRSSDTRLIRQLDTNGYNEQELTEVKIALHMPYLTDQANYERVDGEIVLNNEHFNYVKRRVSNDTLFLMCLPNQAKTRLVKEKNKYASVANDLPASKKNNESGSKKTGFFYEYNQHPAKYQFITPVVNITSGYRLQTSSLANVFLVVNERPPRVA